MSPLEIGTLGKVYSWSIADRPAGFRSWLAKELRRAGSILPHRGSPSPWSGLLLDLCSRTASAQREAEGLSSRFRQASKQTLPAVVTVRPLGVASPFDGAGSRTTRRPGPRAKGVRGSWWTAGRGLVVTNDHVIAGATRGVVVILANGRERPVSQVWRDPKSDLALLAIDPSELVAAPWGDSDRLDIGDWVLAIGGPFGLSGTVTAGIVSGKGRGIGMALYEDLIQTDAAINPGNSGGPLINLQGEVVGINTALKSNGGGYEGVGFAVPASRARRVVADLAEFGRVRRAYLGITIRPLDPATAARLNIAEGAVVSSVVGASPAAVAGLQPGDVVLTVGGRPAGARGAASRHRGGPGRRPARPDRRSEWPGLSHPGPPRTAARPLWPADAPGAPRSSRSSAWSPSPGLHINVPGANLVVPGPNLNITPFGVTRAPRGRSSRCRRREWSVPVPGPARGSPRSRPSLNSRPIDPRPPSECRPRPAPGRDVGAIRQLPGARPEPGRGDARAGRPLSPPRDVSGLVITSVDPDGPADRGGLEPGMVVTDAAGKLVGNVDDFRQVVAGRPPGATSWSGSGRGPRPSSASSSPRRPSNPPNRPSRRSTRSRRRSLDRSDRPGRAVSTDPRPSLSESTSDPGHGRAPSMNSANPGDRRHGADRETLRAILEAEGYEVEAVGDARPGWSGSARRRSSCSSPTT